MYQKKCKTFDIAKVVDLSVAEVEKIIKGLTNTGKKPVEGCKLYHEKDDDELE